MDYLFSYTSTEPLIFTSSLFWYLFGAVLLVFHFTKDKIVFRNLFLLAFSIFFYYKSSGFYFVLLIISTIVDYTLGNLLYKEKVQWKRKGYIVISLIVNLGFLAYYKYSYFFTEQWNVAFGTNYVAIDYFQLWSNNLFGSNFSIDTIFLPVGISFYTFQTLSYSIDIYRGTLKPVKNILDFAFFVSFFPQLVAGPIVRASDFIPQIYQKYQLSKQQYNAAVFMIINGLIKKILISDYISVNIVDKAFGGAVDTGIETLFGLYGYTIQIYCDFSGYTDIAIGLSLLLGFTLPANFNSPYKAENITDFWRRWHISLSSWLRDYLYITLGGNRKTNLSVFHHLSIAFLSIILGDLLYWSISDTLSPSARWFNIGIIIYVAFILIFYQYCSEELRKKIVTYINLFLTMLLGGLWHGSTLMFVIWGALHGTALAIHKVWSSWFPNKAQGLVKAFYYFLTFHFVVLTWVYFRAKDLTATNEIFEKIFTKFDGKNDGITDFDVLSKFFVDYKYPLIILGIGFALHWTPQNWKDNVRETFSNLPDIAKALIISIIIIVLYQIKTSEVQPFIYFTF
ncbi:MAG: MBOAT family protein [Cytophagales bacterium]|nr:MBOAT family protein [Cytophagales bacterium]